MRLQNKNLQLWVAIVRYSQLVTWKPIMKPQMGDTKLEIQSQMWDLSRNQLIFLLWGKTSLPCKSLGEAVKCVDDLSSLACEKIIESSCNKLKFFHICLSSIIKFSKFVLLSALKFIVAWLHWKFALFCHSNQWLRDGSPLKKAHKL